LNKKSIPTEKPTIMKKLIPFLTALLISVSSVFAQGSLTFCEDVNSDGKPVMASPVFMVEGSGGLLKMLVRSTETFKTEKLEYKVFYVKKGGEELLTSMSQKVGEGWNFAWKEVVFYDAGDYKIKVYKSNGEILTTGTVSIKNTDDQLLTANQ
jgi:hypothetical protein